MPLLLRGLEVADPEVRWQIIETLSNNMSTFSDGKVLSTYASTLLVAMLRNCTAVDMPEQVSNGCLRYCALGHTTAMYRKFVWRH